MQGETLLIEAFTSSLLILSCRPDVEHGDFHEKKNLHNIVRVAFYFGKAGNIHNAFILFFSKSAGNFCR